MKIGIVCPYNMALGGAVQEIAKESYDELTRRGHEVVIITPTPIQGMPVLPGYRIEYIDRANDLTLMGTTAQVSYCARPKQIEALLARERFDVLHVHEPWVPLMNRQILRAAQCPVVATFHAKLPESGFADWIKTFGRVYTKPPLKYIDEFVAVSEPAAEHVNAVLGRRVRIIPNAVNLREFTPAANPQPLRPGKKTLLFVGRLEERKGVAHLLRAFKLLHDTYPETQLLIGGKGPQREELEAQAAADGTGAVEFLGYVEDKDKKDLMRRADLFCAPAVFGESFGIILIEALASGQVVAAGNNPGYASVMKEFGSVSLVDVHDATAHAALLEKLLFDDVLRRKYKIWANDYVKQFDYAVVTDQYEAIYERLVKQDAHAAAQA